MAMTIDPEREAFEKWADENDRNTSMLYGEYVNDTTDSAWDAWQARAQLSQPAQAVDVGAIHTVIAVLCAGIDLPLDVREKLADKLTRALSAEKAGCLPWISVDDQRPERNRPAIYWHKSEFGGFAAIADEWRDEHHLAYATHWLPYTAPASPTPDKEG